MSPNECLAAFAISRRSIVLSIWHGLDLIHNRRLALHSSQETSERSISELFNRSLQEFQFTTAAVEHHNDSSRASLLGDHIRRLSRESAVSVYEIPRKTLQQEFWMTPFQNRQQLRDAVLNIWPVLSDRHLGRIACDAVAIGLFVQTQRVLHSALSQ